MTAASECPTVFLGYQTRVCRDQAKVRVIEKSRRIGLSWGIAGGDAVPEAAAHRGWDVFYVGYNREMAEQFISDAAHFIDSFQIVASAVDEAFFDDELDDGTTRKILMFVIRFASGHRIHALSSRPQNLRSKQGHLIIDEAAFHHDLAGLLKAAMAFLMWGRGRVTIISTHDGVDNEFNELCEDVKAGRKPYSHHRITFEEACRDGLYERICLVNGWEPTPEGYAVWRKEILDHYGDDADEELHCIPRRSGGTYIPRGLIEECTADVPIVRLQLKDAFAHRPDEYRAAWARDWCDQTLLPLLQRLNHDRVHYFGQDFGRVSDLSVLAPLEYGQDIRRRVPFLVELRNVPYMEQAYISEFVITHLPKWGRAAFDSTGNGAFLGERMVQKFCAVRASAAKRQKDNERPRVEQISLSDKWYAENMPKVKDAFERGLIFVPRDEDVVRDIGAFRLIDGVPKLPKAKRKQAADKGGPKLTRHGDAGIAIALAYIASVGPVVAYGYKSTKQMRRDQRRPVSATLGLKSSRGGML